MRLFELKTPPLFLHSTKQHSLGRTIYPENAVHPLGAVIEGWLESGRPEHCLPRQASIHLLEGNHGSAPYVYEVQPLGMVERGNTGWLKLLTTDGGQDRPLIEEWVAAYWAGSECPTIPGEWEYRAEKVQITRLIGGRAIRERPKRFDWLKAV